nr:hypothetical protein [Candidatus Eremiobacteraeota bacterium]
MRWYAGGWSILLVLVLLACCPLLGPGRGALARAVCARATFVPWLAATILFFRLPSITSGAVLNADEAQMTAQAITFLRHPIPWLDFDGTTSGPLNTMVLAIPAAFGVRPSLASSRLVGAFLLFVVLLCLYAAVRRSSGELAARVSILLPAALVCAGTDGAYVQYASELLPVALCALAVLAVAELFARRAAKPAFAGAAGLAIGAMPLAKLQAAPLALFLCAACAAVLWLRATAGNRRASWLAFACGVVAVPVLVLGAVVGNGGFDDVFAAYVTFPPAYLAGNCCHVAGLDFFFSDPPFAAFFAVAGCLSAALTCGAYLQRDGRRARLRDTVAPLAFWFVMALVAIYTIEAPQTPFVHYLLFLIVPVTGIVGALLGAFLAMGHGARIPRSILPAVVLVVAALAAFVPLARGSLADNPYLDHVVWAVQPPLDPVVRRLQAAIEPGKRVAMWGWMPQYLVDTGAVMGTRDAISQFQIEPRSFRGDYRARYLGDVLRNAPDFVIEAIGPADFAYHDRATQGIASFPALRNVIDATYSVVF